MNYEDKLICPSLGIKDGRLTFAGLDVTSVAREHGTPLYLYDEGRIRENCRAYTKALKEAFGGGAEAAYASKAAAFRQMYRVVTDENMSIDVVSVGEILTAKTAGVDLSRAYFHSNNKTDADIRAAMDFGVGVFVIDSLDELSAVDSIATSRGIKQNALLRLTPGIDPHTFKAVATGKVDSKFGFAITTGQAKEALETALGCRGIDLCGFHCHVGSQLFDSDVYIRSSEIMIDFIARAKTENGFTTRVLDLGGGYGVRYLPSHPKVDVAANIKQLADYVKAKCAEKGVELPKIVLEPGRSIVADAAITVYTVGSVKKIPGYINYVSVDGGMTDNVRYAMYGSPYTVLPVDVSDKKTMICTLAGRCCESGDVIQPNVELPASIKRGDLVAVQTTGAYNYSMASNYNRIPRPPVVMIKDGEAYVAVRRETYEDLMQYDN